MKLIFFGDLAAPDRDDVNIIKKIIEKENIFKDKVVIGNLEGVLTDNKEDMFQNKNVLYNSPSVIELFNESKKTILSLANNHIKDIPKEFNNTIETLKKNGILFSGAMNGNYGELNPCEFKVDDIKVAIFNHCWNVMSKIMKNKSKEIQVEDESYDEFIKKIKDYKDFNPKTIVIVYFHWNFDFEKLPFPAHRIIAKKLIDNGANIIVGSHSHLVNGGEIYKGKPIIYGLGNFYIPSGKFFNGKLVYPNDSDTTILLEVDLESKDYNLYWLKYDRDSKKIYLIKKEKLEQGELINEYSKYKEMTQDMYKQYFKKNRTKNKLVPIWYNERNNVLNKIKDNLILIRMKLFRIIKRIIDK